MPLISPARYADLFQPLNRSRIGFVQLPGNHGDSMIALATHQMFDLYNCDFRDIRLDEVEQEKLSEPVDQIVIGGGGSMGKTYAWNYALRRKVLGLGVPTTVFPQTIIDDGEDMGRYKKLYARERVTADMSDQYELYPDLALGLNWDCTAGHSEQTGVFLRDDWERALPAYDQAIGDPVELCATVDDYITLAGNYERIVTDRVHFAIAGLMQGTQVILLPGAYFKNRSFYDSWLQDLGCNWANTLAEIDSPWLPSPL